MKHLLFLTLVSLTPVFAGGFWMTTKAPDANPDGVVFVQVLGCRQPANATVSGTAESFIDGKRQSHPLALKAMKTPGLYLVERSTLPPGTRLLAITARFGEWTSSDLLALTADGKLDPGHRGQSPDHPGKFMRGLIASADIDAALASRKR